MRVRVGDHVELKGIMLSGHSGTVIHKSWVGTVTVKLDEGQMRTGSTLLRVRSMNCKKTESRKKNKLSAVRH